MAIDIHTYRLIIGSFQQRNCRNAGDSYTQAGRSERSDVNNNAAKFIECIVVLFCVLNHTHRVQKISSELTYSTGMESLKSHQLFWNDTGHRVFHISTYLKTTNFAKVLPRRAIQIQLYISGIEPNPGPTTSCSEDITERRYNARQEQLRTLQSRLDTFTNQHPRFQGPTCEQIAEAGFYYTGRDDECYCFACGCGLRAWEPGDDPWREHCRYSDDCPFLWNVRGAAFVNRNRRRPELTAAQTASNDAAYYRTVGGLSLNQDTNTHRVFNRVSEEHDQNLDLVQRGIAGRRYNVTEQFRNPFHNQERASNEHNNRNDIASLIGENVQANLETPNLVYPMPFQQERVLYENRRLKRRLMCHICKRKKVDVLLLPCTDHRFCMDCTNDCDLCPYCSRPIRERIRTYMTGRMD